MSRGKVVGAALLGSLLLYGCQKKGEEQSGKPASPPSRPEQQPQEPRQPQQSDNPFQALEQIGKSMTGQDGQKPVPPLDYHKLKEALPDPWGWKRSNQKGEMMTLGQWSYSTASAEYDKGGIHVECKINDFAYISALTAPFMMMFGGKFAHESDEGYEKSVMLGENPAFERWDKNQKSGELTLWVGKRLIIEIEGRDLADPSVLHDFANAIDYKKIGPLS